MSSGCIIATSCLGFFPFCQSFGESEVGFAERDLGRGEGSEQTYRFNIEIKLRHFSVLFPFFVFFYSAMGNNKAHCRRLSSELPVFQGREDILEINVTLPRISTAFESILLRNLMAILHNPVLLWEFCFIYFSKNLINKATLEEMCITLQLVKSQLLIFNFKYADSNKNYLSKSFQSVQLGWVRT